MMEEINVIVIDRGRKNLYLRYTDPLTEKSVEKSAGTASRRRAQKLAGEWQQEVLAGRLTDKKRLTWAEFRESYETLHGVSGNCRRSTTF